MRIFFFAVTIILLQSMTYGVVKGVQWWAGSRTATQKRTIMIAFFAFSNGLLLLTMLGLSKLGFRLMATWQALMWFFIMAMLATGLINAVVSKFFDAFYRKTFYQKFGGKALILSLFLAIVSTAIYNAYTPTVRHIKLTVNQSLAKPIKIAMVADLHLGVLVGNRQLDKLTAILQQQNPELLLIPGDVLDDDTEYYDRENMHLAMSKLVKTVPLGVYATLGNHDVYGHQQQIENALTQAGVHLLTDSMATVDNRLDIIGRPDDLIAERKATAELMPKEINKPVILLDHRPSEIDDNVKLPIDLQVSGHTHNGQVFPANFIVKYLNTVAYGHKQINDTHVLVTSGYGFWGVPFRLGSQSEVWIIDLKGK